MFDNEVSMEITRNGHALSAVKVIMPTWDRTGKDNKIYVSIPFLGIETYGIDEEDADLAVKEAFKCFCLVAEKHGLGLESELEYLGWERQEQISPDHSFFNVQPKSRAIESMVNTGDKRAIQLNELELA